MDDNTKAFLSEMGLIRASTIKEHICDLELQIEQLQEELGEGKKFFMQVAKKGLVCELYYSDKKAWEEAQQFYEKKEKEEKELKKAWEKTNLGVGQK
jgi:hypothetical protein